ncbi:MAG: hypothetical protein IPM64_15970 [Phycisphaerales bacterium]|nr:hypothetical protein [Phycisphaerales bacterium]
MLHRCLPLLLPLLIAVGNTSVLAQPLGSDRKPLREVRSLNTRFELRVQAGRARGERKPCVAEMMERGKRIWRRELVNDVAPVFGAVSDDGRFVVTLDEYRRGGARNALVVYGSDGKLLRHFVLTDLLQREDWSQVRAKGQSVTWLRGAEIGFDDDSAHFIIDFPWGRQVAIDLRKLCVVRDGVSDPRADVPPEIAALLDSAAAEAPVNDPPSIEELAKRSGISQADLERLVEMGLLNSDDLAAKLDELGEKPEGVAADGSDRDVAVKDDDDADGGPEELSPEALAADRAVDKPTEAEAAVAAAPDGPTEDPNADSPAMVSRLRAPDPDPGNPVNYLGWINGLSPQEGVDGAPFYQQAGDAFVPWTGDEGLMDRALGGDANALSSPEVAAWLDRNQVALNLFRQGAAADHRGWQLHSESGMVMDVLLPDLGVQRSMARALAVDARRAALQGRTEDAVNSLGAIGSAGSHVGNGPTLIENLVGASMQALATEALLDSFAQQDGSVDYRRVADSLTQSLRPTRSSDEAVLIERTMYLDVLQRSFDRDPTTGDPRPNPRQLSAILSMGSSDAATNGPMESVVSGVLNAARYGSLRFSDMVREGNDFYDAVSVAMLSPPAAARPLLDAADAQAQSSNPLLSTLAPSLGRAHVGRTRGEASRRATLVVANLHAYRQQNGRYPDSLDAIGNGEIVSDPFTGERFAYRPEGQSFTLYSLGYNATDDGATHVRSGDEGDIVYWPRPPKQ